MWVYKTDFFGLAFENESTIDEEVFYASVGSLWLSPQN